MNEAEDQASEPFRYDPLYEFDAPKKYDFSRMSEGFGVDHWFEIKEAEMMQGEAAEIEMLLAEPLPEHVSQKPKPKFQRNPLLKTADVPSTTANAGKRKRNDQFSAQIQKKAPGQRSVRQKVVESQSVHDGPSHSNTDADDKADNSAESSLPLQRPKLQFKLTVPQSPHLLAGTRRAFKRAPPESSEERQLREMQAVQQQIKMKLKHETKQHGASAGGGLKSMLKPAATAPTGFQLRTDNRRKRPLPEPSAYKDPLSMDSPPQKKTAVERNRRPVAAPRPERPAKPKADAPTADAAHDAAGRAARRQAEQERRKREAAQRQAQVARRREEALKKKAQAAAELAERLNRARKPFGERNVNVGAGKAANGGKSGKGGNEAGNKPKVTKAQPFRFNVDARAGARKRPASASSGGGRRSPFVPAMEATLHFQFNRGKFAHKRFSKRLLKHEVGVLSRKPAVPRLVKPEAAAPAPAAKPPQQPAPVPEFKARPIDESVLYGPPKGIPQAKNLKLTAPESPMLMTRQRAHHAHPNELTKSQMQALQARKQQPLIDVVKQLLASQKGSPVGKRSPFKENAELAKSGIENAGLQMSARLTSPRAVPQATYVGSPIRI